MESLPLLLMCLGMEAFSRNREAGWPWGGNPESLQGSSASECVLTCCLCLEMGTRRMFFFRLLPPFQNHAHSAGDDEMVEKTKRASKAMFLCVGGIMSPIVLALFALHNFLRHLVQCFIQITC